VTQVMKQSAAKTCTIALPSWVSDRFRVPRLVERFSVDDGHVLVGAGETLRDRARRWTLVGAEIDCTGLDAHRLRETTRAAMTWIRGALASSGAEHPIRIWNFLPGIHDSLEGLPAATQQGLDRYRAFNLGRFDAFCDWFGSPDRFRHTLPTATGVGHAGDALQMFALGSSVAGQPVDNPRQIPAFAYSSRFGPRPPCFARATHASLPDGDFLLIGGTASVCGEESLHDCSAREQWRETMTNFAALFENARQWGAFGWAGVRHARAYVRRDADLPCMRRELNAAMAGRTTQEVLLADICRSELLVEVELLVSDVSENDG
jgi:chorismate lyase/3-hydroxybenzoate synthase